MQADPMLLDVVAMGTAMTGAGSAFVAYRRLRRRALVEAARAMSPDGTPIRPRGLLRQLVRPVAAHLRPATTIELEKLETRLMNAGRRGRDEIDRLCEEKVLAGTAGAFAAAVLFFVLDAPLGPLLALLALAAGLFGADKLLDGRAQERRGQIARGLPAAVDLLVTCLDAGLALNAAIGRVAQDLAHSEPILAEELRLTASELDAGVPMADALRRLARRVGLDELSAMCGVIAQASALGAPIAQMLREYAVASRRQRVSYLEEKAGKLTTKLTLPLALCLLPAALMLILGPAAVELMRALK
ncbi:MAG TPA: type II secretion system F family protein [Haliangiales bacterium]|nr:type II secretion system F family protein [Haliangiales bacterium]